MSDLFDWARCGTEAQARQHRRRGERPCLKCLRAESFANQDRRRLRGRKKYE